MIHNVILADDTNHFGMSGMDMRATLLGGTLAVQSSAETGTEIRVEIPTTN